MTIEIDLDDFRELADIERKRRQETSGCAKCGSPDPVRVDRAGCSDCTDYPRCRFCGCWTDLYPSVRMAFTDGSVSDVCDVCADKGGR